MDLQGLAGACNDMHGIALVCVDYTSCNVSLDSTSPGVYFLVKGYWGCAAGWGRIFTTGLTIMGLQF